ncbi:MAG TPA: phosphopantetheine-binding protein [Terriglobales bacterium]|jgi:acyl carrier protein|nr:phosphopantetheine-binding protein [Terriglobales bacterium]
METQFTTKILAIVAAVKRVDPETIRLDASFEELGFDSLDKLNMLFELENAFDIEVPDDEARAIETVKQMVERLEFHLVQQRSKEA